MKSFVSSTESLFAAVVFALASGFFLVPAQAIIIDGVDWTSTWEGNVIPSANSPSFAEYGSQLFTVNSGTTTTSGANAGAGGVSSGWSGGAAGAGPNSTLEFRVKVLSQGSEAGTSVGTALFVGWNGTRFQVGLNSLNTAYAEFGGQNFPGTNTTSLDTTAWHTYRIVFFDAIDSASLYIDGANSGLTQFGGGTMVDTIQFAKYGGEISNTGTAEWDYIRWTNAVAAVPVPEPTSMAFLGLTMILSTAFGRRQRR